MAANRDLLGELLAGCLPQLRYRPPEATYLAWLDCRALGLHDPDAAPGGHVVSDLAGPARMFLDRARVALGSGHVFGRGGAGFVRLNFATSPAILREAVQRMGTRPARTTGLDPRRAQPRPNRKARGVNPAVPGSATAAADPPMSIPA